MKKIKKTEFSIVKALLGSPANILEALKKDREEILLSIVTTATPTRLIKIRKGKGGKQFKYVTGGAFIRALNLAFGLNWTFRVIDREREGKQIAVLGQLKFKYQGEEVIKEQWGSAEVYENVPLGDIYKKATTDALKKCASTVLFGDVYGQAEEIEEEQEDRSPTRSRSAIEQAIEKLENNLIAGDIDRDEALKRIETGLIIVRETDFGDLLDRLVQLKSKLLKTKDVTKLD